MATKGEKTKGAGNVPAQSKDSDIVMLDGVGLSRAIKSKKISCVEVMNAYLDHIDRLNPLVNAIVSLQDRGDLLKQARERDKQLARGEYMGWMHGFPQAIKDLEATKGIRTTWGRRCSKTSCRKPTRSSSTD